MVRDWPLVQRFCTIRHEGVRIFSRQFPFVCAVPSSIDDPRYEASCQFLERNGLLGIIRGHEAQDAG